MIAGVPFMGLLHRGSNDCPPQLRDILFDREPYHHLFQCFVVPAGGGPLGADMRFVVYLVLFAMDRLERHGETADRRKQQSPDVIRSPLFAGKPNLIECFDRSYLWKNRLEAVRQWAKHYMCQQHTDGQDKREIEQSESGQCTDRIGTR